MAFGPTPDAAWRDTARPIKLLFIDAKAVFPLVLMLLHIRWWTLGIAVATILFLTVLNYYGFTMIVFFRWLRSFFAGSRKMAVPWWTN